MRIGSLFSGYGGLDMAVQATFGGELAWWSDIEPASVHVMTAHHPGVPNLGDMTKVDWSDIPAVDILTGGYPCQPFSHAGKRKGKNDARHLWPFVCDAISALRPRLVVLENVAGHLTLGFSDVLADLARVGYDARWGVVRAADAGAPHGRKRLFILAQPADTVGADGQQATGGFHAESSDSAGGEPDAADTGCRGRDESVYEPGNVGPQDCEGAATVPHGHRANATAADANGAGSEARGTFTRGARWEPTTGRGEPVGCNATFSRVAWGRYEPAIRRWENITRPAPAPTVPGRNDRPRLNPQFVEWMMGLPEGHVTGHGLRPAQELKMLGNGVVPQQAALALRMLAASNE